MGEDTGKKCSLRFNPGPIDLAEVRRLAADMWSDLAFDEAALARLKRDGLDLREVRLTGPIPYAIDGTDGGTICVGITDEIDELRHVETLLDLWRLHFTKGLRPSSIAA